jgi:DNA helicase HerA-like ATPase
MGVFDSPTAATKAPAAAITNAISIALGAQGDVALPLKMANRHGLIAGATGTGKTVTLQRVAEEMARAGVPVFCVDIKGDLSGIAAPKDGAGPQVVFWDVFGKKGHPVRTTVSEFGPMLFSRLLDLTEAQTGVLQILFRLSDDQGLLLLDLNDLKAVLAHVAENASEISQAYGLVSPASVAAIQRALLAFENEGGSTFFGEPALQVTDLMPQAQGSPALLHVLAADELAHHPRLYATVMLWLLAELYEDLPEAGDLPKPKLALFIDEAHMLFNDAPSVLVEKIEQVVRLIRSKGVGVYFITQNPVDLPETVLGQLGHRIQHALRAFTPKDQKAVRVAAQTFRPNPAFDTEETITQMGVGEALISFLDEKGAPGIVQRAKVHLPQSQIGKLDDASRAKLLAASPYAGLYDQLVDRESAYERLESKIRRSSQGSAPRAPSSNGGVGDVLSTVGKVLSGGSSRRQGLGETLVKSVVRQIGTQVGREIIRGVLGSISRR